MRMINHRTRCCSWRFLKREGRKMAEKILGLCEIVWIREKRALRRAWIDLCEKLEFGVWRKGYKIAGGNLKERGVSISIGQHSLVL